MALILRQLVCCVIGVPVVILLSVPVVWLIAEITYRLFCLVAGVGMLFAWLLERGKERILGPKSNFKIIDDNETDDVVWE